MKAELQKQVQELFDSLSKEHGIPGASLAVVYKGEPLLTCGFGTTSCEGGSPVTETTAFGIGSITKGFTSAIIARILQEHKGISWDTPLSDNAIFGENFRFEELFRSQKACLRDILAHKLGIELGETDFGWMCEGFDRAQISRKTMHLPCAADFRTRMMYNNFMYALAGQAAEIITNESWENLIQNTFFDLLGMTDSGFIDRWDSSTRPTALPHVNIHKKPTPVDLEVHKSSRCIGPAGSIVSSAGDMAKWMQFLLNQGSTCGVQVIKPILLQECWKPQFALPKGKLEWDGYVSLPEFPVTETRDTYGFGWHLGTYRGYRLVAHAGELFGYDALITLYHDMGVGIYTAINGPGGEAAYYANQLLHYYISDVLFGLKPWLDKNSIATFPLPWKPKHSYFIPRSHTEVNRDIPASRSRADYTGKFRHEFLGDILIDIDISLNALFMTYGRNGKFMLYPNGDEDEFRITGVGSFSFLHEMDLYAPSDWMMVKFTSFSTRGPVTSLICSLFESGPVFMRVE